MDNRDDRANIAAQIAELEARINSLRIRYEQYFSGAEKRAPINEQETLARELRQMNQRKIIQTELPPAFMFIRGCGKDCNARWMKGASSVTKKPVVTQPKTMVPPLR
ncbi:MAG: hypothetical protein B6I36_03590 [Desulfobacteraceae bacterium 4572_35.1]|nr:MAG: hypothetical protein B6I36_03590 [Desulfobacteraceae bacterium 4572_35.1]